MVKADDAATRAPGPRRTCVGCRAVRPPAELVRVVHTPEGSLSVGRTLPGRGAWLCSGSPTCLDQAIRRGGFARSFRAPMTAAATSELQASISDHPGS